MRTFTAKQVSVLIDTFGEPLVLTSGSQITVLFESQPIAIETDQGIVQTQETYLTTKKDLVTYDDTFMFKSKLQEVYNIEDDLSGIINVYFRESST